MNIENITLYRLIMTFFVRLSDAKAGIEILEIAGAPHPLRVGCVCKVDLMGYLMASQLAF